MIQNSSLEIDGLIKLVELTNRFREIERIILIKDSDRKENDLEHSFQLALCAWYVITTNKLSLNVEKAIKYALVHDLVEVYAGDVFFYDQEDPKVAQQKKEREADALEKLRKEFSEFQEMAELIDNYQNKAEEESKFVYALDKVVSPINIYLDGGRIWQSHNITLEKLYNSKKPKTDVYPEVGKYFDQLKEILEQHRDFFAKE